MTPSLISRSHFSVKSFSLIFPVSLSVPISLSVVILILSEFRSLTKVEVVFKILSSISFLFSIKLISVDFPELVSPKMNFTCENYYILVQVCKLNIFLIDIFLFIFSLPKMNFYNNTPTLVCRNIPTGIIQSTTTSFLSFFISFVCHNSYTSLIRWSIIWPNMYINKELHLAKLFKRFLIIIFRTNMHQCCE